MKRAGIFYNPRRSKARSFSREIERFLNSEGISSWLCSAWEPEQAEPQLEGTDTVISVGGDGTILRAARAVLQHDIPIIGINLGRLGFMTELESSEALDKLPALLRGEGWIEQRCVLQAHLPSYDRTLYAVNDVFIGRRSVARLLNVECRIDGEVMATYRADGVLVATPSGSTGYALAAGGPVLHPQSQDMILMPVCSHVTFDKALVLPQKTVLGLTVITRHEAMISVDGQVEVQLESGDNIEVKASPYTAKLMRIQPGNYFYRSLESKLKRKTT